MDGLQGDTIVQLQIHQLIQNSFHIQLFPTPQIKSLYPVVAISNIRYIVNLRGFLL